MLGMPASSSMAMPIGRRSHMRAQLGEEHRDQQADRHGDQHGDQRGDERAVDRRQRAELLGDRIPALAAEGSREPNCLQRRPASRSISDTMTPLEDDEDGDRGGAGQMPERDVAEPQPSRAPWSARRVADRLHRAAVQRQISHVWPPGGLHPRLPRLRCFREPTQAVLPPPHKPCFRSRWIRKGAGGAFSSRVSSIATPRTEACRPRP